jgi:hypothetical protein
MLLFKIFLYTMSYCIISQKGHIQSVYCTSVDAWQLTVDFDSNFSRTEVER